MTQQPPKQELSGGLVNYYLIPVNHPQRENQPPYVAEVDDLIRAMNMTFAEGCEFKALVRTANARLNNSKPGQDAKYDAQKRVHYAKQDLKFYELAEKSAERWQDSGSVPVPPTHTKVVVIFRDSSTQYVRESGHVDWTKVKHWRLANASDHE